MARRYDDNDYDDDDQYEQRPRRRRRFEDDDDLIGERELREAQGKRLAAGICGILLGGLGVHKFVLGYTGAGVIMLVLGIFTCFTISGIIGLIEGIIYLTKSDEDFYQTYMIERKEWF